MKPINPVIILTLTCTLSASVVTGADLPWSVSQAVFGGLGGASAVATADLDRDGSMDVVAAASTADSIWIRFAGPPVVGMQLASGFDGACDVVAADIDRDGWIDVVGAKTGTGGNEVRWWRNPGLSGGAWVETVISDGWFLEARSVAVADLDRDGYMDVLVAGTQGPWGYISWFRNLDGAGTVWYIRDISTSQGDARDIDVADFNGDGHLDVAAVFFSDDDVAWFENDGSIHDSDSWARETLDGSFDGAVCVSAADVDSDGDPDILAGASVDDQTRWWENRIDEGLSWTDHALGYGFDEAQSIVAIDLDQDGDRDVLGAAHGDDRVTWWERLDAISKVEHDIDAGFDGARSAVATDYDSDGDLDVVGAADLANKVDWWENLTVHRVARFGAREELATGLTMPTSVDVGDLDQDGDLDVVTTLLNDAGTTDVMALFNDGSSWRTISLDAFLDGASQVRVTDVNSDGIPDLLATGQSGDEIAWYQGRPFSRRTITLSFDGAIDADTADIDCDGDQDVVAVAYNSGEVAWFENLGTASWTEHPMATYSHPTAIRTLDYNRDGDQDVVIATAGDHSVRILANIACTGTGWNPYLVDGDFASVEEIDVADLNHDGHPDLLASSSDSSAGIAVWLRDGANWLRHTVATGQGALGVRAGDVDLDGDLDVVGAVTGAGEVRVWINLNGSGASWVAISPLDSSLTTANGVAVGDINADGLPDVVATGLVANKVALYANQAGQYMVLTVDEAPPTVTDSSTVAVLRSSPIHMGAADDVDLALANFNIAFDDGTGTPLSSAEANAMIDSVQLWFDADEDGVFDPVEDVMVGEENPLTLDGSGWEIVDAASGPPSPRIASSDFRTFFLTVTTTPDASTQPINRFRITHRNDTNSRMIHYYDHPSVYATPLPWNPVSSATVVCTHGTGLIFEDGFEGGDTDAWSSAVP